MAETDLIKRLEGVIRDRRLLRPGQHALVAVSGGLDSMVLLHLLAQLSAEHRWQLTVAHFNHQLRGRSGDADERLVKRTAAKLGLRFVGGRSDVRAHAKRHHLSIEMAARRLRHDFLARTARRLRIPCIALAHHADDQVELFFLRLLRGSGSEGLAGMKWRNRSPSDPAIELIRPLLDVAKPALREYAEEQGIVWREDATNASADSLRNRVRNELLPWVERRFRTSLRKTILRLMEIVGPEAEFASNAAIQWLNRRAKERREGGRSRPAGSQPGDESCVPFPALPMAVQRRCLHLQLLRQGVVPDFDLVERLRLEPDRAVSAGPMIFARRSRNGEIEICRTARPAHSVCPFSADSVRLDLQGMTGEVVFNGVRLAWKILPQRGAGLGGVRTGCELFDAERVGKWVILRHWQAGDRFQPSGMSAAVKLQDLFTNLKIPRERRHQLIVAEAVNGGIVWVEGLRVAQRFKLDKGTRHRLKWTWKRLAA